MIKLTLFKRAIKTADIPACASKNNDLSANINLIVDVHLIFKFSYLFTLPHYSTSTPQGLVAPVLGS